MEKERVYVCSKQTLQVNRLQAFSQIPDLRQRAFKLLSLLNCIEYYLNSCRSR